MPMEPSVIDILGYSVFDGELSTISLNRKTVINTLNGHSYTVAKKDQLFRNALRDSDILLPDGVSMVIGARVLCGKKIKKIAGYDLFLFLLNYLESQNGKCFFLGSTEATLQGIKSRIAKEFPNVRVGSFSPPYKSVFSPEENLIMQNKVNDFCPKVLFVGMTAPKQEKWVCDNKDQLNVDIICSVGAVFDFYAGTSKRPSNLMINLKLEWLGRLLKEPKRMWRRYLLSTPVFFIDVVRRKAMFKA